MIIDDKYTIFYTVPSWFIDGKCRYTPMGFVTVTQDLAAKHYGSGGVSIPSLQKKGLTWVITKQHFEITDYPLWMDSLILQTWAQKPKGLFCFRDFAYYYAKDGKKESIETAFKDFEAEERTCTERCITEDTVKNLGNLCMRGSSCWVIIDMNTGRPVKPDENTMGGLTYSSDCLEGRVFAKIPLKESWDKEEYFTPSLLDIDMNEHVNNLNYIRWILSFMDTQFCKGKLLKVLDTNFISSAKFGEKLICRCARIEENICIHSIIRAKDESEVFRARTEWTDEKNISRPLATGIIH